MEIKTKKMKQSSNMAKDELTGEKRPKNELYCVEKETKSGKTKKVYYTSKEAYEIYKKECEDRTKCKDLFGEIIGYKTGMYYPTTFFAELESLKVYGFDVVYNTILNNKERIINAYNNKSYMPEYNRIRYVMGIVKNNVMDEYKKAEREKKLIKKAERQPINEIPNIDLNTIGNSKKTNDIATLFGDL